MELIFSFYDLLKPEQFEGFDSSFPQSGYWEYRCAVEMLLCRHYMTDIIQIVSEQSGWTGRQQQILAGLAGPGEGGLILDERMHCYVEESFAELTAPNYVVAGDIKADDSMLQLEPDASFEVKELVVPKGGYVDLRIKGQGVVLTLCDGANLLEVSDFAQEEWTDCRILRGKDGEYSVYTKKAEETKWRLRITQDEIPMGDQEIGIQLSNVGIETISIDFLKVYGPTTNQSVVVIDGATSNVVQNGETSAYGGNVRVLLNLNESDITKGVVAGYSAAGVMVAMEEFDILPGDGEVAYNTKQMGSSDIKTIKIFVWSDYINGTPITLTYVVRRK